MEISAGLGHVARLRESLKILRIWRGPSNVVYLGGRCSTETAAPVISRKDGLSLLGRELAGFSWIAATQAMGNLLLKGFADQWITLVPAIPQSCPSVTDSLSRLLTLIATKQLAVQCLLKHERRIAVSTGNCAYLIVLVNVIVPWTIAIFVTIRIPALRVVHITHNISPGRMLCESQFAEVVAEIFGKI